uniref:Uncharacterized protein n=1 Tax=Tanacetum cinerariifolium TaxID=118510 RepID=A0A699J9Q7_TANCI|nr:hypothetical protein [Tanacetum cinerariifolium]
MLYDGNVIAKETNVISIADSKETFMLEEENFRKRFVPQQELSAEQAFWFQMSNPSTKSSDTSPVKVDVPSELPKVKVFVITTLKNDLRKIKRKGVFDFPASKPNSFTFAPGMFKLNLEPLALPLVKNKDAHIDYIKHTRDNEDILQEIVENARTLNPLDSNSDSAYKYAQRIQVLVYVNETCLCFSKPSEKLIDVTPMNKVKKFRMSSTKVVPHKKTTPHLVETPKPKLKVYSRRPKQVKNIGLTKKAKIVESKVANNSEPSLSWGSNATDVPSYSSLVNDMLSRLFSVPHKKTTPHLVETPKPKIKVYSRRPKQVKNIGLTKKAKIVESKVANNSEPSLSWGSNATDVPSYSSLVNDMLSRLFSGI